MTKEKFMTNTIVVWIGALLCCALWGSAFPCIKIGYELFDIASDETSAQILFAGCRFFLAGILAVIIGSIIYRKPLIPKRESWGKIGELSLLQTVAQYFFFYVGLAHTTGVKASIVEALNVFVAVIVAALIYKQEKLTANKVVGCIIGFVGVLIINLWGSGAEAGIGAIGSGFQFMGEGFIFLSTVAYAFSSIYLKRFSKDEEPFVLSGYQFMIGGIILMAAGALMGGSKDIQWSISPQAIGMLVYLAMISAVAYSLWGVLLKYNSVSKVAVFGFMNPVFGVFLSAILLKESNDMSIGVITVSLLLVVAGTLLAQKKA